MIDTKNSIDRFYDSNRNIINLFGSRENFREKINCIIKNANKVIIDKYNDKESYYAIHSKSTGIGIIIKMGKYSESIKDKGNINALIITILPIKKYHSFKPEDIQIIVENMASEIYKIEGRKIFNGKNVVTHYNDDEKNIVFFEGKYYDSWIDFIFID